MNWVEQVVAEFGQRIGVPQLALNDEASVRLETMDGKGVGFFCVTEDMAHTEVVVYRSIPANHLNPAQYRAVLSAANFRSPRPWPFQAACDQQELILAVRIPERAFMISSLEQTLEDLGKMLDQITLIPQ